MAEYCRYQPSHHSLLLTDQVMKLNFLAILLCLGFLKELFDVSDQRRIYAHSTTEQQIIIFTLGYISTYFTIALPVMYTKTMSYEGHLFNFMIDQNYFFIFFNILYLEISLIPSYTGHKKLRHWKKIHPQNQTTKNWCLH